jgi:hypothetical protein
MSKIDLNGVIRDMTSDEEENFFGETVEEYIENDDDDVQA